MNTLKNKIKLIQEASKTTKLYRDMKKRNGKFAIHKGSETPEILFIGEAAGQNEDKEGTPFIGRSGKILDKWKEYIKEQKTATINAVPIMPEEKGKIRKPTKEEIEYFKPYTQNLISYLNPKIIILLGRSANKLYTEEIMQNLEIKETQKRITAFIYHPSYYLRRGKTGKADFKLLIKKISDKFKY